MGTEREGLYRGLSHAAWGYFFLNFDYNIGPVSVLPQFVGFSLFRSAVVKLSGERRDLALLRPLTLLLSAWAALDWLLSWVGMDVNGHVLFLDLIVTAAQLYFHFQFLTDMAALAERYQPEGGGLDRRLRRRRTVYIVLITAVALLHGLPAGLPERLEEIQAVAVMGVAVAAVIAALSIMAGLFQLRRCFRGTEGPSTFS